MEETFYPQNDYRNYLAHYGVKGMKWGVRKDRSGCKRRANLLYKVAASKEPYITTDVVNAVRSVGGSMYGLEHRLKTKQSLGRKIYADALEKNISLDDSASGIKDAVRYTAISSDKDFARNYKSIKRRLERTGYAETRCRNYFAFYAEGKSKHKSVQSVFEDPSGYKFELQFQTPASQDAKNKKVPLYEERRQTGISRQRQSELENQMDVLARGVPDPPGVYGIKSHG